MTNDVPLVAEVSDLDHVGERHEGGGGRARTHFLLQATLALLLVASNVGQRVAFKSVGYSLGPYPYFVLFFIAGAFVPIFGAICVAIITLTGGFLPETRTFRIFYVLVAIGALNALQGTGMIFANPHVPGYLQALLQQGVIPFTFIASIAVLRSRFTFLQYVGVLFVVLGISLQLIPDMLGSDAASSASKSSGVWALLFLLAQVPIAFASILQERAFRTVKVNIFHMMFWASTSQFVTITLFAPLDCIDGIGDASSLHSFINNFTEAWRLLGRSSASFSLSACIATFLLSQVFQAFMVKHSSAAFTVLCMAFVVPCSAAIFTLPIVMGTNAEHLSGTAPVALALVFVGIVCHKLGERRHTTAPTQSEAGTSNNSGVSLAPPMCGEYPERI